jgi:hypothetical protein
VHIENNRRENEKWYNNILQIWFNEFR